MHSAKPAALTKTYSVSVLGFSKEEQRTLNSMFTLSKFGGRQVAYEKVPGGADKLGNLFLVDADSAAAIETWRALTGGQLARHTVMVGSGHKVAGVPRQERPVSLELLLLLDQAAQEAEHATSSARVEPGTRSSARFSAEVTPLRSGGAMTETMARLTSAAAPLGRVLVVDDTKVVRDFMQSKLAPYDIHLDFADSGERALLMLAQARYNLVFLDVIMPGMDGYEVCKVIRKNKDYKHIKVVMLTSKDGMFDKVKGTMSGCDGYLTKPVDMNKLQSLVSEHLIKGLPAAPPTQR